MNNTTKMWLKGNIIIIQRQCFKAVFLYNSKGLCHVYYKETPKQKLQYKELIEKLNKEEIEAKGQEQFALEQAELAKKWKEKGRKKPRKAAT
jgi:hypothetical protein